MKKLAKMSLAASVLSAGDYLGDVMYGRHRKTSCDVRCQEKKVAKRRARNKMKRKSKYGH